MKVVQVYDKPMCCSTGVCGPQVDPALARFAADLDWLKSQGHQVERFNLGQQPQAFIDNPSVHQVLSTEGTESLPLILIDGQIVSRATFPDRLVLAGWTDSAVPVTPSGSCCGGAAASSASSCCSEPKSANPLNVLSCGDTDSKCC
ncbi:arsenite efflux transporter metallochaperone ArsD [Schlesneria sp. DSM 10557]|uniref:arsenite efflux transporter metallochaperone ArsD n=1 Tax=Schlesneria sp. DSM 10557 TaxID=3044399 RepID=UPI0035A07417